jgi:hypothetical protein
MARRGKHGHFIDKDFFFQQLMKRKIFTEEKPSEVENFVGMMDIDHDGYIS